MIRLAQVNIGYRSKQATTSVVEEMNFSLPESGIVSVIGANGSGKSTLLRSIAGLQPILKGEIFIQNKNITNYTSEERSKAMALVLTDQSISKNLSVKELVSLGRYPYYHWYNGFSFTDRQHICCALETCGVLELKDKKLSDISDGQLQRALIARAIAQDTPILLLDEPAVHLDVHHKASIFNMFLKLCQNTNKLMILATHELHFALQVSDYCIVLHQNTAQLYETKALTKASVLQEMFASKHLKFDEQLKHFYFNPQ